MADLNAKVRLSADPQQAQQAGAEAGAAFAKGASKQFKDIYGALNDAGKASLREQHPDLFQKPGQSAGNLPFNLNASQIKNLAFLASPLLRPQSIWGNIFATRQTFSAMATKSANGKTLAENVGFGAGIGGELAGTGAVIAPLLAVGLALKGLEKIVKETSKAYELARNQYSNALLAGGLSLVFSIRRQTLASIIGVSEKDVYRFGSAVAYLNPKLEFSADLMAKNAASLTGVSWGFKVLTVDLQALFSSLAQLGAPTIRKFTSGISDMVVVMAKFVDKYGPTIANIASYVGKGVANAISPIGTSLAGFAVSKLGLGKDPGAAPGIQAFAKQLPAIQIEHMGLAIGGFGMADNTKQIAANTKGMYTLMYNFLNKKQATTQVNTGYPQP